MSEWKEIPAEEYCNRVTDGTHDTPRPVDIGEYLITSKHITGGKIKLEDAYKISKDDFDKINQRSKVDKWDVLLTMIGTVGEVVLVDNEPNFAIKNIGLFKCGDETKARWLKYYFQSPIGKSELLARKGGTTQEYIALGELRNMPVLCPPDYERRAIVSVLSSLDDKIDLLHRQNKTLEAMAETLFRQWFMEEAQDDWGKTTLEQHVDVYRGLSYKGSGLAEEAMGLPMHNLNSIYEGGGYKYEGIKYYNGEYKERHFVYPGDIIVSNTEQGHEYKLIGFPAVVPNIFGNIGLFSQHIYRLVPKTGTYLSREYIYYLLMDPHVREQVISATNGSTVNMLAIDGLQRPEFKMPPKDRLMRFSSIITTYWNKKELNDKQIETLKNLRDTLLSKLMSGDIRIKVSPY